MNHLKKVRMISDEKWSCKYYVLLLGTLDFLQLHCSTQNDQQTVYFKEWITGEGPHLTCSSSKLLSLGMEEDEQLGLESSSHCDGNSRFKISTICHFLPSGDLRLCVKMCYKMSIKGLSWAIFWSMIVKSITVPIREWNIRTSVGLKSKRANTSAGWTSNSADTDATLNK